MPLMIQTDSPPLRVDDTETIRIGSTRITLETLVSAFNEGTTAEQIVQDYDSLSLDDVYSALGYYLRHRQELDAYLAERAKQADDLRKQVEAAQRDLPDIRARLLATRQP